jgi:hypothetical protein
MHLNSLQCACADSKDQNNPNGQEFSLWPCSTSYRKRVSAVRLRQQEPIGQFQAPANVPGTYLDVIRGFTDAQRVDTAWGRSPFERLGSGGDGYRHPGHRRRLGRPEDYLDEICGMLIPPLGAAAVVNRFTAAMKNLIDDPQLRFSLGALARRRVEATFCWEEKVDCLVEIYRLAIDRVSA